MASSEENPKDAYTSSAPRARRPLGLDDEPAVPGTSDSLRVGPKGESCFPHLEFSLERMTPKADSSSPGPHSSLEDQHFFVGDCAVYRQPNCSQGIPQILPPADIQEDRPIPIVPPGSPDLVASLQILTLKESTGNEEEFEVVDEMYVYSPGVGVRC
jgi:hypothetical protein